VFDGNDSWHNMKKYTLNTKACTPERASGRCERSRKKDLETLRLRFAKHPRGAGSRFQIVVPQEGLRRVRTRMPFSVTTTKLPGNRSGYSPATIWAMRTRLSWLSSCNRNSTTPAWVLPLRKTSSPKSLSFVIRIRFSCAAWARMSVSSAYCIVSPTNKTSKPARRKYSATDAPVDSSMRNLMWTLIQAATERGITSSKASIWDA